MDLSRIPSVAILFFVVIHDVTNADLCTQRVCEYTFVIRRHSTMTYMTEDRTYPVILNGTRLQVIENNYHKMATDPLIGSFVSADDVITADGYPREVITINGQFPGPDIHVMAGSQVVVHVYNKMRYEVTTIHWHGMYMRDTPWMDGAAYITQCPILPRQKFTYRFVAEPYGTHWYHGHVVSQRIDGLYGMMVIHPTVPNIREHLITVSDWYQLNSIAIDLQNPFRIGQPGPGDITGQLLSGLGFMADNVLTNVISFDEALMNGRGRGQHQPLPLDKFLVSPGENIRFRVANVAHENSFEVSIDSHVLDLVAVDGNPITPVTGLHAAYIYPGQTLDFITRADQPPGLYWVRAVVRSVGLGPYPQPDGTVKQADGILVYDGVDTETDATSATWNCTESSPCHNFNCLYENHPTNANTRCTPLEHTRVVRDQAVLDQEYGLTTPDDDVIEHIINFDFTNLHIGIDNKRFIGPRAPLHKPDYSDYVTRCPKSCEAEKCTCTHTLPLPYNKTIQLILAVAMPYSPLINAVHSIHVHGHDFAVLGMGYAEYNNLTQAYDITNPQLMCTAAEPGMCNPLVWTGDRAALNKDHPLIVNSVPVPVHGYTVIRFRSTNPGYWLLHCHMNIHNVDGMNMVLAEAIDLKPPTPDNFPDCGDFNWSEDGFEDYVKKVQRQRAGGQFVTQALGGTTPTVSTTPTATSTPTSHNPEADPVIQIGLSTAIGAGVGMVLVGAIPTMCAILLYVCASRRSHSHKTKF